MLAPSLSPCLTRDQQPYIKGPEIKAIVSTFFIMYIFRSVPDSSPVSVPPPAQKSISWLLLASSEPCIYVSILFQAAAVAEGFEPRSVSGLVYHIFILTQHSSRFSTFVFIS